MKRWRFSIHNPSIISQYTMILSCKWEMLLFSLWIQVAFVPGTQCTEGTVNHLSRTEVFLLKDVPDPKCFARTEDDFTCFFETAENTAYAFLYEFDGLPGENRCELTVQRTEEGTFLHICSFPFIDVKLFVDIILEVVEQNTNTSSSYSRTVSVENNFLLDAPFNTSLHQNDKAGELRVWWHAELPVYFTEQVIYRIRYSSKQLGEKTKEEANKGDVLGSLVPGEEVEVQVSVKCGRDSDMGHWSSWSEPVHAVVPQSADDISLVCQTSDLHNVTCQWNGTRYGVENDHKLFYKMSHREALGWTDWTECFYAHHNSTDRCRFQGDVSKNIRVKLSSFSAHLTRTFFTPEFTLNNSIKTSSPSHPRATLEKDKLCLKWNAPLVSLWAQLQYEVSYKVTGGGTWMTVSLNAPDTETCLDVPSGKQYRVKLRAKPNGIIYSGHWSEWSDVLTRDSPTDRGPLLLLCIPVVTLITAIITISLFYTHFSKLKLYFWPPVPNLDKFLKGFLTELDGQKWDPPITAKECSDETSSSVVEIIVAKDDVSGSGKSSEESTHPLLLETILLRREQVNEEEPGTEVLTDYVPLNKDSAVLCPKGNKYVHQQVGEGSECSASRDDIFQTCDCVYVDGLVCVPPCFGMDFSNKTYLSLAETADRLDHKVTDERGPGNLYTNFPSG